MDFKEYQKQSKKTAVYSKKNGIIYTTLGLLGETGEIAEKLKRIFRGEDGGKLTKSRKREIEMELGDVLWYMSQLATELGLSLDKIASSNLKKLLSRKKRRKLRGKGDNR